MITEISSDKFFDRINPEPNTGCWLWGGCIHHSGYGNFKFKGKLFSAHRLSWVLHFGEVPKDLWVLHKCDVRACANPQHLFLGSASDNMFDMHNKKRHKKMWFKNSHCRNGHEYTKENSYINPKGLRNCRVCIRACVKKYADKKKLGGI